jgi:signal transduction histidine kinase
MPHRTPAPAVAAAHSRPIARQWLGALAAFMVLWVVVSVWTALQEPSLGWRFAPDPQGEGLLAYPPGDAVKVARREDATHRVLAFRFTPAGENASPQQHALHPLVGVEAPSMLSRQDDLDRFFDEQAGLWSFLKKAQHAPGSRTDMQTAQGDWLPVSVRERSWSELGWLYWVPLLCGIIPFVVGMGVCLARWESVGARFLGLASVMALMSLAEIAVVTGRLLLLPPWFAEAGQVFVRCTSLTAVWAFTLMMAAYPQPLPKLKIVIRLSGLFLLVLLLLNIVQWPANQTLRYKLWLVAASGGLIALAIRQALVTRRDPVQAAAARWLAASAVVSFSVVIYAFVISLVYDVQVISNSYRWLSIPLLYIGLVFSVGRSNLFELERWWVPLCMWYLGGTLVVMLDLALVALLRINATAAATVALLLIGWLYFPLRQWLLGRLQRWNHPTVAPYVPDLMGAVNAGLSGPLAAQQAWRRLLVQVFEPQEHQWQASVRPAPPAPSTEVVDHGRELWVPDVGGHGVWRLVLAHGGRHLFTVQHAALAQDLWRLLDLGLEQQRQTQAAVERERERIAIDLHDDLGAKLLTLVQTADPDSGAAGLARQALDDMRQSVRGMAGRPVPADTALADWRAELMERLDQHGLQAEWHAPEPPDGLIFPPSIHMQLTRILRESVSNVIRHSGASACHVRWQLDAGSITLTVDDNGKGFGPMAPGAGGLGLPGMERRARKLGGHHTFGESPLGGARVSLWIPLDPREATPL